MEREFKIGDRVIWRKSDGVILRGVVDFHEYEEVTEYPIRVIFDDEHNEWFTLDGRWSVIGEIVLFHLCKEECGNIHYTKESVLDLINEWRNISGENTILTSAKFKQWLFKNNLR